MMVYMAIVVAKMWGVSYSNKRFEYWKIDT